MHTQIYGAKQITAKQTQTILGLFSDKVGISNQGGKMIYLINSIRIKGEPSGKDEIGFSHSLTLN